MVALFLHDVPYVSNIQRNLLFVIILLRLSFHIVFKNNGVFSYMDDIFYSFAFWLDGFMIINLDYLNMNKIIVFLSTSNNLNSYKNGTLDLVILGKRE